MLSEVGDGQVTTSKLQDNVKHHQSKPINTPRKIREIAGYEAAQQAIFNFGTISDTTLIWTKTLVNINVDVLKHSEKCVYCVAFSPDAQYLAAATADGMVQIYDDSGTLCWKCNNWDKSRWPVTACAWCPQSCSLPTVGTFVSGTVRGDISWWHMPSQRLMCKIAEEDNQIHTISYRPNGDTLATAGLDCAVRIYDEETKTLTRTFQKGYLAHPGHSNKVYASTWKRDDPNILLTGGWDSSVMIWDLRSKRAVRSIFGPHIAGEALDIQNDTILTGSWRAEDPIETWDFGTGKRLSCISSATVIYTAKFLSDREGFCVAGGTGVSNLRVYNLGDLSQKSDPIIIRHDDPTGIYCCDVSDEDEPRIAMAGSSNQVRVSKITFGEAKEVICRKQE